MENVQPVIQVGSEFPFFNQLFQIFICGRYNAEIDLNRLIAAYAGNFALL